MRFSPRKRTTKIGEGEKRNGARGGFVRERWASPRGRWDVVFPTTPTLPADLRRGGRGSALQLVRLDLAVQRRALDVQDARRLALVPVGMLQRRQDVPLFDLFERDGLVSRRPVGGGNNRPAGLQRGQPDVGGVDHRPV